jgi:hypothetical protein
MGARIEMNQLKISEGLSLPLEAARWTFADLAIKSAGKTYAACVLAEEMMKNGIPIVAIDCMGVWWGLRVGVDGHEGLPVVVFGGDHQDIPIPTQMDKKTQYPQVDEAKLQLMVKSILQARISAVIDTSAFSKRMQRRIAAVFISELYRLNKDYGTRHVFLEEADTLAPQRLSGELNFTFGAVDDLVRRGGNFNLGCTLITQRSAVLNKDVLTQCNCLLPKLSCCISSIIIAVCLTTLVFTLPTALNPPQTIQVVCQITQTGSPIIIIHNSTTITAIHTLTTNTTLTETLSRSYTCP